MRLPHWLSARAWLILPFLALGFTLWVNHVRVQQVEYVSQLAIGQSVKTDAASPTGYAGGIRMLIVPGHNNDSYQWIAQTQQMLAAGEWRLRHVDYDNAPFGRTVESASPYRWWLGLVAWLDHFASDRPIGQSVERAALHADPLLHVLLLLGGAILVARHFGVFAAALVSAGMAAIYPFAGSFLPGQPDDLALSHILAGAGMLSMLIAAKELLGSDRASTDAALRSRRCRRWIIAAGVSGGLGLWVDVSIQVPVLIGIAAGGTFCAWMLRRDSATEASRLPEFLPWRAWSVAGAATSLAAWAIEFAPTHLLNLRLEENHPLYALAWLGLGELLTAANQNHAVRPAWTFGRIATCAVSALAIAAVPAVMIATGTRGFLSPHLLAAKLSPLPNGPVAENFGAWLSRDGLAGAALATCLPLVIVGVAVWLLTRRGAARWQRTVIGLALGPVCVAIGFAVFELRWWNVADSALLALMAAVVSAESVAISTPLRRWLWVAGATLILLPGAILVAPPLKSAARQAVAQTEIESLIERDFSHWLARRTGDRGAIVLAPPHLTTSLYFHGGLRGIGTPYRENADGFTAAVRIAGATSPDEGQALAARRELSHIVIPSWDGSLDEYARRGTNQPDSTLVASLHRWLPPRWLRPVPYRLPDVEGFQGQSVAVFEVVDVQDNATALSWLAEYFVEMELIEPATAVSKALEDSFPSDLGALVARAQVQIARRNSAGLAEIIETILPFLSQNDPGDLPWDRRVSLALVLAQGNQPALARAQMQLCLDESNEALIRSLSLGTLYRLLAWSDRFGLGFYDDSLRALAWDMLPTEIRETLTKQTGRGGRD